MGHDVPIERKAEITDITQHELKIIMAYRSKPEMQPAIDKLLGIGE